MPVRLQDYELFLNNEVSDNGDLVYFKIMDKFEPVKIEEALSDPKWISAMEVELESNEKNKTWELVDIP